MEVVFGLFSLVSLIGIAGFVLWVWTLIDAIRTPDDQFRVGNQLIWVLVIVFTTLVGSIIYLAVGRPQRGLT